MHPGIGDTGRPVCQPLWFLGFMEKLLQRRISRLFFPAAVRASVAARAMTSLQQEMPLISDWLHKVGGKI
jgi:hypothetical protein